MRDTFGFTSELFILVSFVADRSLTDRIRGFAGKHNGAGSFRNNSVRTRRCVPVHLAEEADYRQHRRKIHPNSGSAWAFQLDLHHL